MSAVNRYRLAVYKDKPFVFIFHLKLIFMSMLHRFKILSFPFGFFFLRRGRRHGGQPELLLLLSTEGGRAEEQLTLTCGVRVTCDEAVLSEAGPVADGLRCL